MGEYKHGSKDITENVQMFNGFLKASAIVFGIGAVILIFLAFVGT
ncbi:MAG: aa3-type cytochrome c oxidase subunit IV [Pseudomonadota bacterium]